MHIAFCLRTLVWQCFHACVARLPQLKRDYEGSRVNSQHPLMKQYTVGHWPSYETAWQTHNNSKRKRQRQRKNNEEQGSLQGTQMTFFWMGKGGIGSWVLGREGEKNCLGFLVSADIIYATAFRWTRWKTKRGLMQISQSEALKRHASSSSTVRLFGDS